MTGCICVYPADPAIAARVARIQHPHCPQHGGDGRWKVIPA